MTRLRQIAACHAEAERPYREGAFGHSPALSLACDAWSAVDRLAQMTPDEQASVRGVILALEHKIAGMKDAAAIAHARKMKEARHV